MNTKANIIIIEDEKNICNFIETVLSPQGYQVTSAYTGTDGLSSSSPLSQMWYSWIWVCRTWTAWNSYKRSGPPVPCPLS